VRIHGQGIVITSGSCSLIHGLRETDQRLLLLGWRTRSTVSRDAAKLPLHPLGRPAAALCPAGCVVFADAATTRRAIAGSGHPLTPEELNSAPDDMDQVMTDANLDPAGGFCSNTVTFTVTWARSSLDTTQSASLWRAYSADAAVCVVHFIRRPAWPSYCYNVMEGLRSSVHVVSGLRAAPILLYQEGIGGAE